MILAQGGDLEDLYRPVKVDHVVDIPAQEDGLIAELPAMEFGLFAILLSRNINYMVDFYWTIEVF